jgi:hypothetical protein
MMKKENKMDDNGTDLINKIAENIANFAVDREDIKAVLDNLPEGPDIKRAFIDYELQILKIISVGWGLSVYMAENPKKDTLAGFFWTHIREFSKNISTMTHLTTGAQVDYFTSIKEKFDIYLDSLGTTKMKNDPASAIGPTFAELCNHKDNPFIVIAGARMFNLSVNSIREYLETEFI